MGEVLFFGLFGALAFGGLVIALAIASARYSLDGKWHLRHRHHCGFHKQTLGRIRETGFCPGCGETNPQWERYLARATLFFGWEEKAP